MVTVEEGAVEEILIGVEGEVVEEKKEVEDEAETEVEEAVGFPISN
jgi:hypothetical protein